jgi:hypothetical protein
VALAEAARLPEGLVGVVDVGTFTTEYLLLEVRGWRPRKIAGRGEEKLRVPLALISAVLLALPTWPRIIIFLPGAGQLRSPTGQEGKCFS